MNSSKDFVKVNQINDEDVYILGIGNNTVTIMDLVEDCGYNIKGLLHYNYDIVGHTYFGKEVIGCFEDYLSLPALDGFKFVLSMGNLSIRERLYNRIISKNAIVSKINFRA